jgi:hypothetical protein
MNRTYGSALEANFLLDVYLQKSCHIEHAYQRTECFRIEKQFCATSIFLSVGVPTHRNKLRNNYYLILLFIEFDFVHLCVLRAKAKNMSLLCATLCLCVFVAKKIKPALCNFVPSSLRGKKLKLALWNFVP